MAIRNEKNIERKKIKIQFESYLCSLKILESSVVLAENTNTQLLIAKENGKNLYLWAGKLLEAIAKDFNSTEFKVIFRAKNEDYITFLEEIEEKNQNSNWNIEIEYEEMIENKNILKDIKNCLEEIENCNVNELREKIKEKKIRTIVEEIEEDNIVEIAVIATMSSGKSTLINAIAGSEIVPSKNEACTATICKIENDKTLSSYKYKREEDEEWKELKLEEIKEINAEEKDNIYMRGNLVGIEDNEVKVVLVDTPGPNSSQNQAHKNATYAYINDNTTNPLILYILNATQLATNDDAYLLREIGEIMEKNGKQGEERFIFVLNKVDSFDPEKESIETLIKNTEKYLNNFGIKKPKIFPVSAELAKLCRIKNSVRELTRAEKTSYEKYKGIFLPVENEGYQGFKIIENTSLYKSFKQELLEKIDNIGEETEEALLDYSGITAIEMYINKYIAKYAKSLKVRNSIQSMKNIVEDIYITKKSLLEKTEEEIEELLEEIKGLNEILQSDDSRVEEIRKELENLNTHSESFEELDDLNLKIEEKISEMDSLVSRKEEKPERAYQIIVEIRKQLGELEANIKGKVVDLSTKKMNELFERFGNRLETAYREEFKKCSNGLGEILNSKLKSEIPDSMSILREATYEKEEVTGRTPRQILASRTPIRKWWNPISWFCPDYEEEYETVYDEIREKKEYVDMSVIYYDNILPIKSKLREEIIKVREILREKIEEIRDILLKQIDLIEENINKEIEKLEMQVENSKNSEKQLEKNKKELDEIVRIKNKIENILEGR